MASGPRFINFEALEREFQRYISFIGKLREPYKSHLDATLVPFFVYIYLSMLRGKQVDIGHEKQQTNKRWGQGPPCQGCCAAPCLGKFVSH
ncbi:hypothetical protein AVEN_136800-1 [Araneus ventricosus]|uniref:TFIID subunit TAF5 NTD2 domain-containing protein n=1 Tax=Araneus ventricosus TaxID=182803 RepID=A0A4Y2R329_ARAVE|nr:hypothetical protein AVEN_136800-1 [Araneus ventricosus]